MLAKGAAKQGEIKKKRAYSREQQTNSDTWKADDIGNDLVVDIDEGDNDQRRGEQPEIESRPVKSEQPENIDIQNAGERLDEWVT